MTPRITPKRPPRKWYKYQLLEQFGLADIEFLRRSICRYPWNERDRLYEDVRREIENLSRGPEAESTLFVVKFVPSNLAMLLPNIRIQNMKDLPELKRALREAVVGHFQEIWYCRTSVGTGSLSVAGRILVDAWGGTRTQSIEQVWRCSPRLIESLGDDFPYPFVRATRSGWGWPPVIAKVYCPSHAPESEATVREQFSHALRCMERVRERMEHFVETVLSTGIGVCSLEYKIEGNHLQIIDWDSLDEGTVLDKLLPNEEK